MDRLASHLPILGWGRRYDRSALSGDLIAAVVVTVMLIPQSLAYALLAGLPPQVGLYASILPLVAYGVFGTSRALAVGPVAVTSLMTASAVAKVAPPGSPEYYAAAIALAAVSGLILAAMGLFRLGMLADFLSHPVIAGFVSASGILIATSQLKGLLGIDAHGDTVVELLRSVIPRLGEAHLTTVAIGLSSLVFLFWVRSGLSRLLTGHGVSPRIAGLAAKVGPVLAVTATTLVTWSLDLPSAGVAIVGDVPAGLPKLVLPQFDPQLWGQLALSALLISVVGFVESVSVGRTLAARHRERIDPDQELVGLGAANLASAISGGYPVTGGFARSAVNHEAGARTPAAGILSAAGIAAVALALTPLLRFLPIATLAATIVIAVLSIIDLGALRRLWGYSRNDFAAMLGTMLVTLGAGVEIGIVTGVALSLVLHLHRTSTPHVAVLGLVPGTEYLRNVERHEVRTAGQVLALRVDESLYFPNVRFLEDTVSARVADQPEVRHLVLVCSAVNDIDASALDSLSAINERLRAGGVTFHLAAVHGPVMDRLRRSTLPAELSGQVFATPYAAYRALAPELLEGARGPAAGPAPSGSREEPC